jgi:corrinoid protein of di/trimethylamine methyltransferase
MEKFTLDEIKNTVVNGDAGRAEAFARKAIKEGIDPSWLLDKGFIPGIQEVGRLWEEGEYFLPELMLGADAVKAAMAILVPAIESSKRDQAILGKIVIGTVEGDIHDIGKSLVASILTAYGFHVHDLGADVRTDTIIREAEEFGANIICLSALLTTTMVNQKKVIEELVSRGLRSKYRVLIGGAPVTAEWAREVGADGYGGNAIEGAKVACSLLGIDS